MSKDRHGRDKSDSGTDRAINSDQSHRRSVDYSEESKDKTHYVVDTLKPPPRPGRSDSNGDSNS